MISNRKLIGVAAVVLLIMGLVFLCREQIFYKNYATQYGETMTLVLSDESRVVLNANTYLKVPRWLWLSKDREVWMNGEAFFTVSKKDDGKKFIVHTNHLDIEVLGTRFNVTDRHEATKVVLQEGKVKVISTSKDGEVAMLENTGDFAQVNENSPEIIKKAVDESLYTTWQEKRLKFKETSLKEVLQAIEDYYGVHVVNTDSTLYDRKFSGTLPNNDLNIILQALTNVYGSKFTIHQD